MPRPENGAAGNTVIHPDDVLDDEVVESWRARWADAQRDAAWIERHQLLNAKRAEVLPEIEDLIKQFLAEGIGIDEFREIFDRKTRNEWDLFGLKGLSGAMFLNKLVKHLPEQKEAATALRRAMRAPVDDSAAREQIEQLGAYLDRQVEAGVATVVELQPNRSSFFLSACWHVQQPDRWPITFQNARKTLQADGLLRRDLKGADKYLAFTRVFSALARRRGFRSGTSSICACAWQLGANPKNQRALPISRMRRRKENECGLWPPVAEQSHSMTSTARGSSLSALGPWEIYRGSPTSKRFGRRSSRPARAIATRSMTRWLATSSPTRCRSVTSSSQSEADERSSATA